MFWGKGLGFRFWDFSLSVWFRVQRFRIRDLDFGV